MYEYDVDLRSLHTETCDNDIKICVGAEKRVQIIPELFRRAETRDDNSEINFDAQRHVGLFLE